MNGATPKRLGTYSERLVVAELIRAGYPYCHRQWGSLGPFDVLAMKPHPYNAGTIVLMVQVKRAKSHHTLTGHITQLMGPAEREALLYVASQAAALPVYAVHVPREGVRYYELTGPGAQELAALVP